LKIGKGIIKHYQPFKIIYFSWGVFTHFHDFCMSFSRAFSGTPFTGTGDVLFTEIVPYPLQLEVQLPGCVSQNDPNSDGQIDLNPQK
jgi:hypothetical protein